MKHLIILWSAFLRYIFEGTFFHVVINEQRNRITNRPAKYIHSKIRAFNFSGDLISTDKAPVFSGHFDKIKPHRP